MCTSKFNTMKQLFYITVIVLFMGHFSSAQNKQILFGFDEIPQNLLINPSANIHQKYHFSVPMLSGIYAKAGVTGFSMNDLLEDDGVDVNTKLKILLENANNKDYYTINQEFEVFNGGFLFKEKNYISFGFYEEMDFIFYHPKDIVTLFYEGNQDLSKQFKLSDLSLKAELLGVLHVGVNRKIDNKLTLGLRAKLYSSVFNLSSRVNSGVFSTRLGEDNIYRHQISNAKVELKTSGIIDANNDVIDFDTKSVIGDFLASGNMGLGFDFGMNYKINHQVEVKASINDLGFIRHKKNTKIYKVEGSYNSDGIGLLFPNGNFIDYWNDIENDFDDSLPDTTEEGKYTTMRSLKVNGGIGYKFGSSTDNNCLRSPSNNTFSNEVGVHLFSIFRPKQPQFAGTLYYNKRFSKHFQGKVTYTADDFSATNIGAGFSTQIGMFNLYALADNLIGFTNLAKTKSQSFQFGMNIIWN